jgi:hypothetical protein
MSGRLSASIVDNCACVAYVDDAEACDKYTTEAFAIV